MRGLTDAVLRTLVAEFDALYSASGRLPIAPEYIPRALLLPVFYAMRSGRLLVDQIDFNLLFRWFVSLGIDDALWNHAVFYKNRSRRITVSADKTCDTKNFGGAARDLNVTPHMPGTI